MPLRLVLACQPAVVAWLPGGGWLAPRSVVTVRCQRRSRRTGQRGGAGLPPPCAGCDQEVSKRTLATLRKVCEEVSNKEMRNHCEPRDVRVSLPRRADESSEVRSSGDNVPTSASLDVEVDSGRTVRLNASEESS